jgi:hypothetical protein
MSTSPPSQLFGAWTGTMLLIIYVAVVMCVGMALMQRRDA